MANQEIHIKDFYDIDDGFKWMEEVKANYHPDVWISEVEVRLLSSGTTQIMLTFKRLEPDFVEDLVDDNIDLFNSRSN